MSAIIEAFFHFCFDIDGITKVLPGDPFLLMNMSTLQRAELSCLWRCLHTAQGPELHLDMSTLKMHVLHREVSTPQGPELHLEVSTL